MVKNAIFGLAIGDALGVPAEFQDRAALKLKPITTMIGGGFHGQPAGTWSDDTSMALCLMASVAAYHRLEPDDIMRRFADWREKGQYTPHGFCFDCGGTCGAAISRYLRGLRAKDCGGTGERDNGNGSLMRILPLLFFLRSEYGVGWYKMSRPMWEIQTVSSLTHAHPISVMACGIYLQVAEQIIQNDSIEDAIQSGVQRALAFYDQIPENGEYMHVWDRIRDASALKALPEDAIKSGGYVVNTLEAALWCLLNTGNYADCVLKAVNLGRDTDTTGAVAGGLAGIAYGWEGIPKEWVEALQARPMLNSICHEFSKVL